MARQRRQSRRYVRAGGFVLGLALFGLALASWRVPPGDGRLGTDLTLVSIAGDELSVSPAGPFVVRRGLTPASRDEAVVGRLAVRNPTRRGVRVQLRAPADRPSLDRLLRVEATVGDTVLFRGPLARLRTWTRRSFGLAAEESRDVELRAWLPRSVGGSYRGRMATLNVEFRPLPRERHT